MGDTDSKELEKRIKIIERRIKKDDEIFSRLTALNEIVEYCGWMPDSYQGKLIGLSIDWVVRIMEGNIRKNGEPYSLHCIMTLKGVSELGRKVNDITLGVGAVNHDNIEEVGSYRRNKKEFINAKDDSERERISRDIEKIKLEYKEKSISFLNGFDPNLIRASELDTDSLFEIECGLTKWPDEQYYEYMERIFGRKKYRMPKYDPVFNILRMAIIKTADRLHNNSTVPLQENPGQKNRFRIPYRLKECYKSNIAVNRSNNFTFDFPQTSKEYPEYFDFLIRSRYNLIKVAEDVLSENISYTNPIIEERIKSVVDGLYNGYNDFVIRKPATEDEIAKDQTKVFDGTLARYDGWIKTHRGDIIEPDNIRLNPANKRWMREVLGVTDPYIMAMVQARMDSMILKGVFEKLKNPNYTLRGFSKLDD